MRLKSIELKGFKSFHNKTKIEFPDGIISIVGPNGSGKSNVLDAFRWVLGEQSAKTLRGDKMEDVIFSGTKRHAQSNFCEVEIVFNNEDQVLDIPFSEVSIKRKAYRDGDSSYYINGKTCRLKEIKELLLDSGIGKEGYSVISQGKIDEIVNATSVQRRKLLEEASGIAKFRFKKEESEKKLESTKTNMERLRDIYNEIEKQIEPLKKQSEKALKYLELKEKLKVVEINCLLKEYDSAYENNSADILALEKILSELDSMEIIFKEHIRVLDECENEKQNNQELISTIDKTRNELNLLKNNIENNIEKYTEKIEINNKQIIKIKSIITTVEENLKELDDKTLDIEKKVTNINFDIKKLNLEKENEEKNSIEINARFQEYRENYDKLFNKKQNLLEEKHKKTYNLQFLSENIEYENKKHIESENNIIQMKKDLNQIEFESENFRSKLNIFENKLNEFKNAKISSEDKLKNIKQNKLELEKIKEKFLLEMRDIRTKQNIYISMEREMDGLNKSVKTILENKKLNGIIDVVANLISTEKKYEKAIETALGASLQYIVTTDSSAAKYAVEFLKKTQSGRATFLPLDTIKGSRLELSNIVTASSVISCDPKYNNIVESLLGRTILVKNMDEAVILSKKLNYKYRIVTLDGEIFNQGGSITGGHYYKQSNLLGRKRIIKEYDDFLNSINLKINENQIGLEKIYSSEKVCINKIFELESEISNNISQKESIAFSLNDLENKYKYVKNSIENLESEINRKKEQQKDNLQKIDLIKNELDFIDKDIMVISSDLDNLNQDRSELDKRRESLLRKITEYNLEISKLQSKLESLNVEKQGIITLRQNYLSQLKDNKDELYILNKEISDVEKILSELNMDLQLNQIELDELNINLDELRLKINKSEIKFKEISEIKKNDEAIKFKKIEEKYRLENKIGKVQLVTQTVAQKIEEEYNLTIDQARAYYDLELNYERNQILDLKMQIESLGNINLDSIEDYKVLAERYELYKEQIADIEQSIEALENIISGLEKDMTKEFKDSFDVISDTFGKVFAQLFGGGEGKLILQNPSDILNSEIEIAAQPEGKKLKSISVMSGGEKALMAIALLFSILMTRPAPFCILDEIDAALDDSNIVRFSTFLEKLSDEIQFITITHRRGTMETSDYIYGVTMQDKGVSKIVSLKFEEATDFIEQ